MKRTKSFTQSKPRYSLLLVACMVLIASGTALHSQSISIGPKAGISIATGAGDDLPDDVESITGFTGGVFFKFHNDGLFAFQPELMYVRKGGFWDAGANVSYELTIDYLQIPLLAKIQLPVNDQIFPFVYAGPYGAFQLDNEGTGQFFGLQATDPADLQDFDAGLVLGAGFDFEFSKFFMGLDARYDIGMVNIYEEDSNGDQADIKNRSVAIMLGVGIHLD